MTAIRAMRVAMAAALAVALASAEELCSVTPASYSDAATTYPYLSDALDTMSQYSTAFWYTDRTATATLDEEVANIISTCGEDTRVTIVVYGIPNKDCNAGYSSGGTVSSAADYKAFLTRLTDAVGTRKVLYVVEPDALGLLSESGGCGASNNYLENLQTAVELLSANANAELYVDIGYWTLMYESNTPSMISYFKQLVTAGRVKGIALNTSNYRATSEIAADCDKFQTAMGSTDYSCIIDTSRNYNGSPTTDWCNVMTGGVGHPPTSETGYSSLAYFMWVKPVGESDGNCNGGPSAGAFWADGFKTWWNQGYFVNETGASTVDASGNTTTKKPTATTAAPASTTASPASTTAAPASTTAAPATTTSAPATTTAAPVTSTDASEPDEQGDSQANEASEPASEAGEASEPASEAGEASEPASEAGEASEPASEAGEASEPASEAGEASEASSAEETTAPETEAPETEAPETEAPATTTKPTTGTSCKSRLRRKLRSF